ncbi:interleukin-17C [Salarias fasciatus]|uniref:interleukin-17C n=1 Tax=Salarias fasciatus TaxID=181472 RepID=UPI001176E16B|nr:interleukin-17C-like [Salarias fasciatus]
MELTLQQIALLLALLSGVRTQRTQPCYAEHELERAAQRKLQHHYPQPAEPAPSAAGGGGACPIDLYAQMLRSSEHNDRSVSPWRYETVSLPDHYPSSYVRAACLCSGCIQINGSKISENFDFNSAALIQNRIFLKRQLCEDGKSYRLVPESVKVEVGCTCVVPERIVTR